MGGQKSVYVYIVGRFGPAFMVTAYFLKNADRRGSVNHRYATSDQMLMARSCEPEVYVNTAWL